MQELVKLTVSNVVIFCQWSLFTNVFLFGVRRHLCHISQKDLLSFDSVLRVTIHVSSLALPLIYKMIDLDIFRPVT